MTDEAYVAALHLHPVKGLRGYPITTAQVEPCGLAGDRRWMAVDAAGRFLSQRQLPGMARVLAEATSDGLILRAPTLPPISVPHPGPDGETITVSVWRSTLPARLAHRVACAWLSEALGAACRLVHLADAAARPVDPAYGDAGDRVSLADGYPVLLTSMSSLGDLNARLADPVPMRRFRPNLVIAGADAWAEDRWRLIRVGGVVFRVAKPCSRCSVITIDQESGERPDAQEPLRTLTRFRRTEDGVMFGQNMIPQTLGSLAVGDAVTVLEAGRSNVLTRERTMSG